jgi:predicted GNAT family acetyltransferase
MLREITDALVVHNQEIKARAESSSKSNWTKHYVAVDLSEEMGFISVDIVPNTDRLVLYEIFIPLSKRGNGYGAKLIAEVERKAIELGLNEIRVCPCPLDKDFAEHRLREWYKRQGYIELPEPVSEFTKRLPHKGTTFLLKS